MTARGDFTIYESPLRFHESRLRAAAVYCSDGRFGEHFDDFLHHALKLPRYDRLAVPGGAGLPCRSPLCLPRGMGPG